MCRLDTRIALLIAMLSLTACSGADRAVSPSPSDPPPSQLGAALVDDGGMQAALAIYEVALDPVAATASAEFKATRAAQQNDDLYLLPVDRFFGVGDFEVESIRRSDTTLDLSYTIRHPFARPDDPWAPPSATNRADLGVAGMAVFLLDVETATGNTYFSNVVANTHLITNADAYYQPAGLLGLIQTANCFPYKRFVDESGVGNRFGLTNFGDPTGNFGSDSWTRAEFGPAKVGWTGYGVLHQGQSATAMVSFDLEALGAVSPLTFEVALIAKYNDPRGGTTSSEKRGNRLPPATPDQAKFGYRMPHGALDVEAIVPAPESGGFIADTASSSTLRFHVVDWDARATETTFEDLAEDPSPTSVALGASGPPGLAVCIPGVLGGPHVVDLWNPATTVVDDDSAHGGDAVIDAGYPDDALFYERLVSKSAATGQPRGVITGMVRAADPENGFDEGYLTYLDRDLEPVVDEPLPVTYQAFTVYQQPSLTSGWVAPIVGNDSWVPWHTTVAPDGSTVIVGEYRGSSDFNPGPGVESRVSTIDGDNFCVKLTPSGALDWVYTLGAGWGFAMGVACTDAGDIYIVGRTDPPQDFDPGPGEVWSERETGYCVKLAPDGEFVWVAAWGKVESNIHIARVVVDARGGPRVAGLFLNSVDLDPGPGEDIRRAFFESFQTFCVALSPDGQYEWGRDWGFLANTGWLPVNLALDSADGILLGAIHSATADFDPGPGSTVITPAGEADALCLNLDAAGNFVWARTWGGPGMEWVFQLNCDASDQVTAVGVFRGTADLDPGPGENFHTSIGPEDGYCVALDGQGDTRWAASWDASTWSIAHDTQGNLRITGGYTGTVDFDPGPGTQWRTAFDGEDAFCLGLDPDGNYQWTTDWPGTVSGLSVAVAPDDSLRVSGFYDARTDFDPSPGLEFHDPGPQGDSGFVTKLTADGTW